MNQPHISNCEVLRIEGEFHIHLHLHFDHAALGAKLREATNELKDAVAANQPSPSTVPNN